MASRIIAVGNLKGGTGKSTVAVNLACQMAAQEHAVLLIDADPQATASAWLQDGFAEATPPQLAVLSRPLERAAGGEGWRAEIRQRRARHERIVIDLPPQIGHAFEEALRIADLLVVPVTPSAVDLYATAQALTVLHRIRTARDGRPACILVPSKVDRRTSLGRQSRAALARLGCEVAPALCQRAVHAEAFGAARWIGVHAPESEAYAEVRALAAQVEDRLCRCKPAEPCEPAPVSIEIRAGGAAREPGPATPQGTHGAPTRLGGAWLHFLVVLFARLRRAEQQAYF